MTHFVGIYAILNWLSPTVIGWTLVFFCVIILRLGRWRFEGMSYDVAFSSWIGDSALICIIVTGCAVLRRGAPIPSLAWQAACIAAALYTLIVFFIVARPKRQMDIWHNIFTVPVLVLLLSSLAPVIIEAGSPWEKVLSASLFITWVVCLTIDLLTGRLDQEKYLRGKRILAPYWKS